MAVKVVRQPNKIAVLGAPTSAAVLSPGHEGAPAALRAAGLVERLSSIGYVVADLGDDPPQQFKPDENSPRARNLPGVLAAIEALKPRVEQAVKSAALPLILGGDCSIALATVAGVRRYFRHVSMIYIDRDADLNTPASTPSGCVDGMVVSHLTGRGAPELIRFWGEPPLVREPDLALFGVERLDPPEEDLLRQSPLRRYLAKDVKRKGATVAAQEALDRIRGNGNEFILHLDVDVIADFHATNYPGSGGLSIEEVREALLVFVQQKHLAAIEVTAYNPTKDSDGRAAKMIVDLLTEVLAARLDKLNAAASVPVTEVAAASAPTVKPPAEAQNVVPAQGGHEAPLPSPEAGEAWSSDSLDTENEPEPDESDSAGRKLGRAASSGESDGSSS